MCLPRTVGEAAEGVLSLADRVLSRPELLSMVPADIRLSSRSIGEVSSGDPLPFTRLMLAPLGEESIDCEGGELHAGAESSGDPPDFMLL